VLGFEQLIKEFPMALLMPPEWSKHERTWLAWPAADFEQSEDAYLVWSEVANVASEYEQVTVLVNSHQRSIAQRYLSSEIELLECPLDHSWLRDTGASFVIENEKLAAIDWKFNGWGAPAGRYKYELDNKVARFMAEQICARLVESPLINEGGAIHTNGKGLLLATETVQLGPERNPNWTRTEVECELNSKLGTDQVVWIHRGLTRDYESFGTLGHVDIVACFASENLLLVHDQTNESHPDYIVSRDVISKLTEQTKCEIVRVPAPRILNDTYGFVDYSYINHYILNDAVLLCAFGDPSDSIAKSILEEVYPGRQIRMIDARPIFERGGGIHCITQQQPAVS
jgi:agmatine deiminase